MHDFKAPSLSREGWGESLGWVSPSFREGRHLTLHLNTLSSNELHRMVKFFYLMQLFNNTTSIHSEMIQGIRLNYGIYMV